MYVVRSTLDDVRSAMQPGISRCRKILFEFSRFVTKVWHGISDGGSTPGENRNRCGQSIITYAGPVFRWSAGQT